MSIDRRSFLKSVFGTAIAASVPSFALDVFQNQLMEDVVMPEAIGHIEAGKWTSIAFVKKGSSVLTYLNGESVQYIDNATVQMDKTRTNVELTFNGKHKQRGHSAAFTIAQKPIDLTEDFTFEFWVKKPESIV